MARRQPAKSRRPARSCLQLEALEARLTPANVGTLDVSGTVLQLTLLGGASVNMSGGPSALNFTVFGGSTITVTGAASAYGFAAGTQISVTGNITTGTPVTDIHVSSPTAASFGLNTGANQLGVNLSVGGSTIANPSSDVLTTGFTQSYNQFNLPAGSVNLAATTVTIGGAVTGNPALNPGLTITGNATFNGPVGSAIPSLALNSLHVTGSTAINTGNVITTNTQSFDGGMKLGVAQGSTVNLTTTGSTVTVSGNLILGATAATATDTVSVTGNFTLSSGGTFTTEVDGSAAGAFGNVTCTGTATITGTTLAATGGVSLTGGSPQIITAANPIVGAFNSLAEGNTVTLNGIPFCISYLNNDVTLTPPATVYVDQSFAGTPVGASPVTAPTGLTLQFGYNAFADIQSGLNALDSGGTLVIFADNTSYAGFTVNRPVAAFDINQNPQNGSGSGLLVISTPVTLNQNAVFTQATIQPGTNPLAAADLEFDGNIVTGGTPVSLTINGNTSFVRFEAIGSIANPLSLVNVASSSLVTLQQDVATTTTQTYHAPVRVEDSGTATLTGTSILFAGTVDSNVRHGSLTISGDVEFDGIVGGGGNLLTNLQVSGTTAIDTTAITTSGTQTYGNVTLGANTVLGSTGIGTSGNISFNGTVQSPGTAFGLTVNTAGVTLFGGAVGGGGNALGALTTDAAGFTQINGGSINTTGFAQIFNDKVTLGQSLTALTGTVNFRSALVLGSSATTATSTLQITGSLKFTSTATVTSTIAGTAAAAFGHIVVSGSTTFGNARIALNYHNFTPIAGNAFTIVRSASRTGQFINAPAPGPVVFNGISYLVTYTGRAGADFILSPVPIRPPNFGRGQR